MSVRSVRRRAGVALVALAVAVVLAPTAPSGAAGMTTHTWMAEAAIDNVGSPDLRALLLAHADQVRAGAKFPDGGYVPGNVHGEEAHWQRFTDAMVAIIQGKACGDLTDPDGPCAAQIAHLMGISAHGTGDEVWDWLFEPQSPDRDEYYTHPDLPLQDEGGQEMVMDLVAIGVHGRPDDPVPPLPSKPDLIAAFAAAGLPGVTEAQLDLGQAIFEVLHEAQSGWADQHLEGVLEAMPWMSANLVEAQGGIEYAAAAIAGQWDALWAQILGDPVSTEVSITYPADGQEGIPASGWVRSYQPGSHRDRGGARTRIAASLTYSLPYRAIGGPGVSNELPEGSVVLTERDSGTVLPSLPGYPRAVPYGADAGEHTIAMQPGIELSPCTWYRVQVTASLLDARGEPVVPHSWEFRTGLDAEGSACPDEPPLDEVEDFVDRAYQHLLGRVPDDAGSTFWVEALRDGRTSTVGFARALTRTTERRARLVTSIYGSDLGRQPDPGGAAAWGEALRSTTVDHVRSRVLGSPEALTVAGGTAAGWVDHAYRAILGRDADARGRAHWVAALDGGRSRAAVARVMLASGEARARTVRAVHDELGLAAPDPAELAGGAAILASGDVRTLAVHLVSRPPYAPVAAVGG